MSRSAPRRIAILGSTGSIGRQTLDIVRLFPEQLQVEALTARTDLDRLACQIDDHRPAFAALTAPHPDQIERASRLGIACGEAAMLEAALLPGVDLVIVAVVGTAGLAPALAALEAGKDVALATKEALVVGGELMTSAARRTGAAILPIDSEHSAVWQCLRAGERDQVEKIVLTASGGPFVDWPAESIARATAEEALRHPTWNMGGKITIDSASLMNKGLELIEARWLFDLEPEQMEVVVHRQSIIHSLVYFQDSSVMAQLGLPDMRLPIQYALFYPARPANPLPRLNLAECGRLTFESPDASRFPCLDLARRAMQMGGAMPCVMSAANEVAVQNFLEGEIRFGGIPSLVEQVMDCHTGCSVESLPQLLDVDAWARRRANELAPSLHKSCVAT